jgi:hypothetical protein
MSATSLPTAPACALDATGMRDQLARYRAVGRGATLIARTPSLLAVELGRGVDERTVQELLAVERACCPFFTLSWSARSRRLTIGVSAAEHEVGLDAIHRALGLDETPSGGRDRA